jgi:hypothetical protein
VSQDVIVPDGYHGVITEERGGKNGRFWRVMNRFEKIVLWNTDSKAIKDPIQQGIKYLEVAELIHGE